MREIKFRGLQENGIWRYGDFAYKDEERATIFPKVKRFGEVVNGVSVPLNTVGQFVGFKDKNGVEIYDGDIIEVSNDLFVVQYSKSYVAFRMDRIDIPTNVAMVKAHSKYYKVVGNIYENKELLK